MARSRCAHSKLTVDRHLGREEAVFAADEFSPKWHEIWPHAEGTHMVTGNHFLQEDSGAEIGDLLVEFALRNVPIEQKD